MGDHEVREWTDGLDERTAGLPVYVLFIAAFIPAGQLLGPVTYQGAVMFGLYTLGAAAALGAAWVVGRFTSGIAEPTFVMELPPYRVPQWRAVFWRVFQRAGVFIKSAGRIILLFSILFWFMAVYPKVDLPDELAAQQTEVEHTLRSAPAGTQLHEEAQSKLHRIENQAAAFRMERSAIGRFGHLIEPVMRPLGFDWKLSAGIVSSFAAREVIISALGTIYSVGGADGESVALRERLTNARDPETGERIYTPLVAMSLLVFFVLAMQCMSTLAVARRELNSWRWPAYMWLSMTALAYVSALIVYQGGLLLGFG